MLSFSSWKKSMCEVFCNIVDIYRVLLFIFEKSVQSISATVRFVPAVWITCKVENLVNNIWALYCLEVRFFLRVKRKRIGLWSATIVFGNLEPITTKSIWGSEKVIAQSSLSSVESFCSWVVKKWELKDLTCNLLLVLGWSRNQPKLGVNHFFV